jgi:hypothetical protein
MRIPCLIVCTWILVLSGEAIAHGPQIQTTFDAGRGKIVTRRVVSDADYDTVLTPLTSVYVMPLAEYLGVWRAQPDGTLQPDSTPAYIGWPGFAYGFGYDATTNPAPFPVGSKFVLSLTAGLKSWDGAAFVDAGVTEAEIYRGSSAAPSALAKTTDVGPYGSVMFPGGAGITYASEGSNVHNTVNYRMVGDGSSITSSLSDGIYLLSLRLSSTDMSVAASDPFYFVLSKNGSPSAVAAASASLGFDSSRVQVVVPEPITAGSAACLAVGLVAVVRGRRKALRS